jgi:hypothetical protein
VPVAVPSGIVFDQQLTVIAYEDDAHLALLTSSFHWWWVLTHASRMRTDPRYSPTKCFETFPQPPLASELSELGSELAAHRSRLMRDRREGLTRTYNRVHSPEERSDDIEELRRRHGELDYAVAAAYGWVGLDLDHGFHETELGVRFTIGPAVRTDLLDRLLRLNYVRYGDEVRRGVHKERPSRRRSAKMPAMSAGRTSERAAPLRGPDRHEEGWVR